LGITPGLTGLLARLHRAQIDATAPPERTSDILTDITQTASGAAQTAVPESFATIVNWAAVPVPAQWSAQHFPDVPMHPAGGAASLEADRELRSRLAASSPELPLALLVKAWEPPLLDLLDFLRDLRGSLPRGRELWVFPLDLDASGTPLPPAPSRLAVWQRRLAQLTDPWLHVAVLDHPEDAP
jgi:hypothetical protein